jgi:phosphoribosylformylglycinamidine cyclo-ligase
MSSYKDSGVDIASATHAKQLMAAAVRSTHTPAVLAGMGAFGGCYSLAQALGSHTADAVLVASTDGVGTKTLIAGALGVYDTVGQDLVNHCINDILVQGARPLFFLDYIATAMLVPEQAAAIVAGVAHACRTAGCALLGGETAEMPDVYRDGAFDLAGTIVGLVTPEHMLPHPAAAGDALLALPSSGLHTNGYSLARRVLARLGYDARPDLLNGQTIGEALLAIHRSYLPHVEALWAADVPIRALAHITGGGLWDNLPRVLPEGLGAQIRRGTWPIPPICELIVQEGGIAEHEAFHALNMGLGMLVVVPQDSVTAALQTVPEARLVGEITGTPGVELMSTNHAQLG